MARAKRPSKAETRATLDAFILTSDDDLRTDAVGVGGAKSRGNRSVDRSLGAHYFPQVLGVGGMGDADAVHLSAPPDGEGGLNLWSALRNTASQPCSFLNKETQ